MSDHPLDHNRDVLRFGRLVPVVQPRKSGAVPFQIKMSFCSPTLRTNGDVQWVKGHLILESSMSIFQTKWLKEWQQLLFQMNLKKSLVSPCRQDIRCLAVGKCILIIAVIARYGDIVLNSIARARYRRTCECRLCHRHTFLRTKYKHLNASCEVGVLLVFTFQRYY